MVYMASVNSPHGLESVSYTHLVVRTLVVVRIRPWFGPIISSPALSVVVFVFEEFGHCLDRFYLAASPLTNDFFVIMV